MTHLAITEPRNGTSVQWMEKVSDEQYNGAPRSPRARANRGRNPPSSRHSNLDHRPGPSGALQQRLAPGLATLTDEVLYGDVWAAVRAVATRP